MKITRFGLVGAILSWTLFFGAWSGIIVFAQRSSFLGVTATWALTLIAICWMATALFRLTQLLCWDLRKDSSVKEFDWLRHIVIPMVAPILGSMCLCVALAARKTIVVST